MPYGLLAASRPSRAPVLEEDDAGESAMPSLSQTPRLGTVALVLLGLCMFAGLVAGPAQMRHMRSSRMTANFEAKNETTPRTPECKHCAPCRDREECLGIVDDFFTQAPKGRIGLYRTYARALNGGDCELCDTTADFNTLKKRCDIYDNALAALYLTKRNRYAEAQSILDVFLRLLYPVDFRKIYPEELYRGGPSGHTVALLAAAYECDTEVPAGSYQRPDVFDGAVDAGNNAWVAMAFAHFAAATGKGCYRMPAEDILHAISMSGACQDHLDGFLARLPPWRGSQRSVEHNIDLYAVASMLGRPELQQRAATFVESMYGKNGEFPQAYNVGTVGGARCDTRSTQGDGIPADGQFWNLLADLDNQPARVGKSLSWVIFADTLWDFDTDVLSGREPAPELHGTRFTSKGYGAQWEETAGAVMALAHFLHYRATGSEEKFIQQLKLRLAASRTSLKTLLNIYKAVPASVRGGNGEAYNHHDGYAPYPGGSDTGMGFSYLRMIHIASTAWTGLTLLYQTNEDDEINSFANPFKLPPSQLPEGNSFCLPGQTMPRSSVVDRGCEIARWS